MLSNNDLCSADVLTIARNTRQVNTSAEHRSLLLVSCPPFSTYGLGVRYICSLAPVPHPRQRIRRTFFRIVHVRQVEVYTIVKTVLRYSDVGTGGGATFEICGDAIKVAN